MSFYFSAAGMGASTTRLGATAPQRPCRYCAVNGAWATLASLLLSKGRAFYTAKFGMCSDLAAAVLDACMACDRACTPVGPLGHGAIGGASMSVAGADMSVATAGLAAKLGGYNDRLGAFAATHTAGCGAAAPLGPTGEDTVDRAGLRVA